MPNRTAHDIARLLRQHGETDSYILGVIQATVDACVRYGTDLQANLNRTYDDCSRRYSGV